MVDMPPKLIVADIGNTTVHFGLCGDGRVLREDRVTVEDLSRGLGPRTILEDLGEGSVGDVVMATVNPPARAPFASWSRGVFGRVPKEVGREIAVPIRVEVDRPEEVGIDRLLNALSAYERCRRACIVVDFGTAITLDAVSEEGAYVGGAIAPGLRLAARALWSQAALIPPVEIHPLDSPIGKNTDDAVRIGVIQGALGLVERLVHRMEPALGGAPEVVATGGDAELIAHLSESIREVIPQLTLDGIRIAYERHRGEGAGG
jgi:type III pantothenate kinase